MVVGRLGGDPQPSIAAAQGHSLRAVESTVWSPESRYVSIDSIVTEMQSTLCDRLPQICIRTANEISVTKNCPLSEVANLAWKSRKCRDCPVESKFFAKSNCNPATVWSVESTLETV